MKVTNLAISLCAAALATASLIGFVTQRNSRLRAEYAAAQAQAEATRETKTAELSLQKAAQAEGALAEALTALTSTRETLAATQRAIEEARQDVATTKNLLKLRDDNELTLNRRIAELEASLLENQRRLQEIPRLQTRIAVLEQELALAKNPIAPDGKPSPDARNAPHAILALGPDDSFMIIDFGAREGAATGQRLIIRRQTELIGTAIISSALKDVSIAQIDPHSLHEALRIGDGIILAQ